MLIDKELCTKCKGFCCSKKLRKIPLEEMTPKWKEYFDVKSGGNFKIIGNNIFYVLDLPCPHHKDDGCDLGDKRPQVCKEFPPHWEEDWIHFCPLMSKIYKRG